MGVMSGVLFRLRGELMQERCTGGSEVDLLATRLVLASLSTTMQPPLGWRSRLTSRYRTTIAIPHLPSTNPHVRSSETVSMSRLSGNLQRANAEPPRDPRKPLDNNHSHNPHSNNLHLKLACPMSLPTKPKKTQYNLTVSHSALSTMVQAQPLIHSRDKAAWRGTAWPNHQPGPQFGNVK